MLMTQIYAEQQSL